MPQRIQVGRSTKRRHCRRTSLEYLCNGCYGCQSRCFTHSTIPHNLLASARATVHGSVLCARVCKSDAINSRGAISETSPDALGIRADETRAAHSDVSRSLVNRSRRSINSRTATGILHISCSRPIVATSHLPVGAIIISVYTSAVSSILRYCAATS